MGFLLVTNRVFSISLRHGDANCLLSLQRPPWTLLSFPFPAQPISYLLSGRGKISPQRPCLIRCAPFISILSKENPARERLCLAEISTTSLNLPKRWILASSIFPSGRSTPRIVGLVIASPSHRPELTQLILHESPLQQARLCLENCQ
jgi:hypothetical protein